MRREEEDKAAWTALCRSQAVIEFTPHGIVTWANELFLDAMGYELAEIVGRHHRMFCAPELTRSADYEKFWQKLAAGAFDEGIYKRFGKNGQPVYLRATYNPVFGERGKPRRILKVAANVTAERLQNTHAYSKITAVDRSQAVIEFALDGTILDANENFLAVMGYELSEVRGQHHRMFCTDEHLRSQDYVDFWRHLSSGQFHAGLYRRLAKDGREVWLQATYNPMLDTDGTPLKVVKIATDVTATTLEYAELRALSAAIHRSQATVEFTLDGTIISANDKFVAAIGYSESEMAERHHRMLCTKEEAASVAYQEFWTKLGRGQYDGGVYKRRSKDGSDVWLQATYNPILDPDGKPFKIVKFAQEITSSRNENAEYAGMVTALSRSQALVEFDLDGRILNANENFLSAFGYTRSELIGQHHRIGRICPFCCLCRVLEKARGRPV